jgi:hypothetical protein
MIKKPTILITSIGRTGTEFFAKFFAEIIPDCTSLHEPDIVKFPGVEQRVEHYSQQIQQVGIWRIVILKALGKWSLVKLSDARFLSRLDYHIAVRKLATQRQGLVNRCPGSIYVESNLGYYGLLDVIPEVFDRYKAIYIVRDGRDWVRSTMNWGEVYGKKGIRKLFAHKWPTAKELPDDPFSERWNSLSKFEKLCWAWTNLNEFALNSVAKNTDIQVTQFEKIFLGVQKYQYLGDLIAFATAHLDIDPGSLANTSGWLEKKIHKSSNDFPGWGDWSKNQKGQFERICGPLMEKLGYEL